MERISAKNAHEPADLDLIRLDRNDPLLRPQLLKRLLDVAAAMLGLILLAPLFVLISIAVWSQDGGSIFHLARRVGRSGRLFRLLKFRTMITGADKLGPGITAAVDARITPIGRLLRRTKLDELPQLINVLRGEMSLVGPRPEDPLYVALYNDEQRRALLVRPGITSAASLLYRNEAELLTGKDWEAVYSNQIMPAKLDLDLDYLAHASIWSDVALIFRTINDVLNHSPLSYLSNVGHIFSAAISNLFRLLIAVPERLRNRHFLLLDALVFLITPLLALALRIDESSSINSYYISLAIMTLSFLVVKLCLFLASGLYTHYWGYASIDELAKLSLVGALIMLFDTVLLVAVLRPLGLVAPDLPRSVPIIDAILSLLAVGALRYSVRASARAQLRLARGKSATKVIVAGAGPAGARIIEELKRNPALGLYVVALVDDSAEKQGLRVHGVPVLGRCHDIASVARYMRAKQVIIAMPRASGKIVQQLSKDCEQNNLTVRTMAGVYESLSGKVNVTPLRNIRINDLLRREPISIDTAAIAALAHGRSVMVAGGGGAIGSELCRQLLAFAPAKLIVLGHDENSVFEICNELEDRWAKRRPVNSAEGVEKTTIIGIIADIRMTDTINEVYAEHKPELVFHAAAYKHVPLMEANPIEAVSNNVLGTRNLIDAASRFGVEKFVLISSDKAVNPTSIMGATKRIAELLVHEAAQQSGKAFVAVRFGKALGSRGSVVQTFRRQMEAGGPITITHAEQARYFMTIPEASQLVLQAAALGAGGEIFTLDMGKPVKIVDLAKDMVKLAGLELGHDIDIVFTGARPGEKTLEETFLDAVEYKPTAHEKIFIASNATAFVPPDLLPSVNELEQALRRRDKNRTRELLRQLVPQYRAPQQQDATNTQVLTRTARALRYPVTTAPDLDRSLARLSAE